MPCHILWSGMLRLGRGGQRQALLSPSGHRLIRQTIPDDYYLTKLSHSDLRGKAPKTKWPNKQTRDQTVQRLVPIVDLTFPCQKGVQNRTFPPDPRTFTNMSPIWLQTPLVSWWYREEAFGNPCSGRDFHLAHLGTSRHKHNVQGCLDTSN